MITTLTACGGTATFALMMQRGGLRRILALDYGLAGAILDGTRDQ